MPQPKTRRTQPKPARKTPWPALAAAILVLCVAGYFLLKWAGLSPGIPGTLGGEPGAPLPIAAVSAKPAATPYTPQHLYSETADPNADIKQALVEAKREHKRVLIDFGGDWCGDCQVLDIYFHQSPNDQLLANNFVLVHVWVGHIDTHLDVPEKYGVLIHKGVPELAVLSPDGKVVYAQKGEFEDIRHMESSSVTEFLEKWKG